MMGGRADAEQRDCTRNGGKQLFHDARRILQYAATMPSVKDFRRLALALDGTIESAHMGHPDFRAHGRIFATIQHDPAWGGLLLTPEQQQRFLREHPDAFKPAAGAWGAAGSTLVHFASIDEEIMGELLTLCWQNAAGKNVGRKGRTGGKVKKGKKR
jgi:hypothetical protein